MTARPIILRASEIRATLDGRKTQARRTQRNVPPQRSDTVHGGSLDGGPNPAPYLDSYCGGAKTKANPRGMTEVWCWWTRDNRCGATFRVPWVPGDRLWVREAFQTAMSDRGPCWLYRADHDRVYPEFDGPDEGQGPSFSYEKYPGDYSAWASDVEARGPWRSSIHMPRWASRLTLIVTELRVQRLQDISEEDAAAEGCPFEGECKDFPAEKGASTDQWIETGWDCAADWYADLWDRIHGPGAWEENPWVAALTFEPHRCNIDALEAA